MHIVLCSHFSYVEESYISTFDPQFTAHDCFIRERAVPFHVTAGFQAVFILHVGTLPLLYVKYSHSKGFIFSMCTELIFNISQMIIFS